MRNLLAFVLMIALVGSAAAADLGSQFKDTKTNSHVMMNPGTPDGREGGETMATAYMIAALPFSDTGNTADNVNDYDAICPYSGSTSPDVVYSFTPAADMVISVDLCGSGYDTKTYVMDGSMNLIACNDDFYFDATCGTYVSFIEQAWLTAGVEYFVVIDGYGGDAGDYIVAIEGTDPPEPCILECSGAEEGEPAQGPAYVDYYNSGCNDDSGLYPFQSLIADDMGELVFCGKGGWNGAGTRDTDWFIATLGELGVASWTLDAEQESYGFILGPQDCATVGVLEQILVGPCAPAELTIQGNPGDLVWLWVGASTYDPPAGFVGYEYNYVATFSGLEPTGIATENVSFDGIKSLYR
jgi:hypothetical protein